MGPVVATLVLEGGRVGDELGGMALLELGSALAACIGYGDIVLLAIMLLFVYLCSEHVVVCFGSLTYSDCACVYICICSTYLYMLWVMPLGCVGGDAPHLIRLRGAALEQL